MTTSGVLIGVSLLGFIAGAIISFISWQIGLSILLLAVAVACVSRYRSPSAGFAGALALIPALIIAVYVYGSVDRESPVYDTNVPLAIWLIFTTGCLCLILGLSLGGLQSSVKKFSRINFADSELFFWVGVAGVTIGVINYSTGIVPVFAADVNSARFGAVSGLLAQFWLFVHPITQMSLIIALLKWMQRQLELRWALLGLLSAASLFLSGARSLIVLSLVAFGVIFIEQRRPKISRIFIAAAGGLAVVGLVGRIRALQSPRWGGVSQYQSFLARRGIDNWFGSLDLSLQTGPRVMTTAIDYRGGEPLGGQIFLGDFPRIGAAKSIPSDQFVTLLLGRDPGLVGGSPPTIFGGMFLDFSWIGVIIGGLVAGLLLAASRRIMYRNFSLPSCVWFGYFAAYVALSGYSFLSLKPAWFVVLFVCIGAQIASKEANGSHSDGFQISEGAGRSRTASI